MMEKSKFFPFSHDLNFLIFQIFLYEEIIIHFGFLDGQFSEINRQFGRYGKNVRKSGQPVGTAGGRSFPSFAFFHSAIPR